MRQQCSEIFEKVFDSHGGGCLRICACGRTHFDSSDNGWGWEEGELEKLLAKAKKDPNLFVEHDGTVGCMEVDGKDIVYDCSCNLAERCEEFLIQNATHIAEYLNKRAKKLRETAAKLDVAQ